MFFWRIKNSKGPQIKKNLLKIFFRKVYLYNYWFLFVLKIFSDYSVQTDVFNKINKKKTLPAADPTSKVILTSWIRSNDSAKY